ncbi:MAG TPA: MarR family transcriptional regulator [Duganella sp.]|uniref:MarR family winged helix-turn-helix transcriptional regulator n=1 Tax=Duganella sp. TaxID=1904440 RepID=UPI002ED23281
MSPILKKQVNLVNQFGSGPAEAIFDSIHSLMHMYRSMQLRSLRDTGHELTHMEYKVLGFFAKHPGASQSELVAHSGRDKAQLARLMRGLRDKKLLDAQVDESDRRSARLKLTDEGMTVIQGLQELGAEVSTLAVTGMSAEECAQLQALLQRVRTNLESADITEKRLPL